MIEFNRSFFEGEERDGFYVESEMKRVWAAEMEVLMEIDRVCQKHNIPYFVDSGTLLGAVRHNGFIPWDDDVDIAMLRSDYMKFLSVVRQELTEPIFCSDIYRDEHWTQPFARVVNGAGIILNKEFLERFHDCPYGVGVDIFVLDNLPSTEEEFHTIIDLYSWIWSIKTLVDKKEKAEAEAGSTVDLEAKQELEEQIADLLQQVERDCKVKIDREKNISNQLLKIIDGMFAMYGDEESTEVVNMSYAAEANYHWVGRKKEWYRESIRLPFENITVPVPIDFYKVLEKAYGPNYLTPVKKWKFHDYPFYKEDRKKLQEIKQDVRDIQGKMSRLEKLLGEKMV